MKKINKKALQYIGIYTIVFTILTSIAYFCFWSNGRGLIRYSDGLEQFYYSVAYLGSYMRTFLYNLFANGKIELPMWDMSIGYGSDILSTLHCYAIGDPLNLLTIFFDESNMEYLFQFLMIFRIYLAGLSYSTFAFYHGNKEESVLLGAIVYCFSGWLLVTGMAYVSFANPMIYFPLFLLGIDKILKKEKPFLFIIMVAISAISYFYFFYMFCILAFLYGIFAYIRNRYEVKLKSVFGWLGKFLGYTSIGICISAVVLLPMILTMLTQHRMSVERTEPLFYQTAYYLMYPANFITYSTPGKDQAAWGFISIALPAVILLFLQKRKNLELKIQFVILNIFMLLPIAGIIMNGFSYPANRWIWAYTLLVAFIVTKEYEHFMNINKTEGMILGLIAVCYIPYWYFIFGGITSSLVMLEVTIGVLLLLNFWKSRPRVSGGVFLVCAGLSIAVNSYAIFSTQNMSKCFLNNLPFGTVYETIQTFPMKDMRDYTDTVRYDQYNLDRMEMINSDIVLGTKGVRYQYSVGDFSIAQFYDELYINSFCSFSYNNLDGRSILETLASVRYFLVNEDEKYYIPWNYKKESDMDMPGYSVYENEKYFPLGYTYSSYIPREEWELLPVEKRQYALMQGVVLKKENDTLPRTELEFSDREVAYQVQKGDDVWKKDGILISEDRTEVLSDIQGLEKAEYYVIFEGLDYEGDSNVASIMIQSEGREKTINYATKGHNQSTGKNNYLCNLGYFEVPPEQIEINFLQKGKYKWDSVRVISQPIERIGFYFDKLRGNVLENIAIKGNKIEGTINLKEEKILCLSIPFRKGWEAYVDGDKTEIMQANTMFMAIQMSPGEHSVMLKYHTPGIYAGIGISIFGIIILFIVLIKIKQLQEGSKKYGAGKSEE